MAKTSNNSEHQNSINLMLNDIENIQGFITQEIIKSIEQNGGKLPLANDKEFQEQINSLLNADPKAKENDGKAVLSFKATERGIEEKITSLRKKGAPETELIKVQEALSRTRNDFSKKLDTNEGIKELVSKRVVSQLLLNKSDFFVRDQKTKENRFLRSGEKQNYVKALREQITLPPQLLQTLLDPKKRDEYEDFQGIIYKRAGECFAHKMKATDTIPVPVLDQKKLTNGANVEKFKSLVKYDVGVLYNTPASRLVGELIANFETKGKKISVETKVKFIQLAENVTKELGADYVQKNLSKVAGAVSKEIDKNKTLISGVRNDLRISSAKLGKVVGKINSEFKKDALQFNSQEALNERLGLEKKELPKAVVKTSPTLQTGVFNKLCQIKKTRNNFLKIDN